MVDCLKLKLLSGEGIEEAPERRKVDVILLNLLSMNGDRPVLLKSDESQTAGEMEEHMFDVVTTSAGGGGLA